MPIDAIDPVFFDKAYYLAPDKGGAKPYALLAKALHESDRCAIGRWAARGKQYIVMIRPIENADGYGLIMQQLLYAAEVRSMKDIERARRFKRPDEPLLWFRLNGREYLVRSRPAPAAAAAATGGRPPR